jgi:hypothetical protein
MKPTLPEDREIDADGAEISRRYRETAREEPSARIDAAILEAARREAGRPVIVRNWQVPAAVAAVLVIGVSLSLLTREGLDPLPPLDQSPSKAEVAKPAAPSLAMKADPAPKGKFDLQSRPSRDRSERVDREAEIRPHEEAPAGQSAGASPSQAPAVPAPAPPPAQQFDAPVAAAQAPAARERSENSAVAQSRMEGTPLESSSGERALQEKTVAEKKALADAAEASRARPLRKEESVAAVAPAVQLPPEQWLRSIEEMFRSGQQAGARVQLAEFRKRYPDYRLPDALKAFEREAAPATK